MTVTTISSREFNQDVSRAKKEAKKGPVYITDRGKPAHVLLTIEEFQKITGARASIVDLIAMPDASECDFEASRLKDMFHPADLS